MTKTFGLMGIATITLLSACGGSSTGPAPMVDTYETRINAAIRASRVVQDFAPTAWTAMPDSGSATFKGQGTVVIDPIVEKDADDIIVLGDTSFKANFATGKVTGRMNNLQAATNFVGTEFDELDASGRVDFGQRRSDINDADQKANEWDADYRGTINVGGKAYKLDGFVAGQFRGTRVNSGNRSPVKSIAGGSATQEEVAVTGGKEYGVSLEVFATN